MKRFAKTMLGVTLLEILLVLAIAAMIIVMSVRYYQSASTSQQANTILSQVQSIAAAADSLAQASGSYETAKISGSILQPLLPANGLNTPWGSTIEVAAKDASSYSVTIPAMPSGVCGIVKSQLSVNTHFTITTSNCGSTNDFTYTYKAN